MNGKQANTENKYSHNCCNEDKRDVEPEQRIGHESFVMAV
jgi:hypothetical protein